MLENSSDIEAKKKNELLGDLPEIVLQNLYKSTVQHFDLSKEKDLVSLISYTHAHRLYGTSFEMKRG